MRVALLSTFCATLLLGALPVAAHDWSSDREEQDDYTVVHECPVQAPSVAGPRRRVTHVVHAVHHRGRAHIACPIAQAAPRHDEHVVLAYRSEHDWSHEDADEWRDRPGPVCPASDRWERLGDHRAYEDRGMPCHDHGMRYDEAVRDGGMHYDEGDARWRGVYREEEWSSSERHDAWRGDCGCDPERPSATDRFGFLTWPGKVLPYPRPPIDGPNSGQPDGAVYVHP